MQRTDEQEPLKARLAPLFEENREGLAGAVRGILGPSADAVEVIQEAFLRAWRALDRGASVPQAPRAWIFVITMNTARDLRRKQTRRGPVVPLEEIEPMTVDERIKSPERRLEGQEAVSAARLAIQDLREQDKEVFLLKVSAGLTFGDIAKSLNIPEGTAKTRMRRALSKLREELAVFAPVDTSGRSQA